MADARVRLGAIRKPGIFPVAKATFDGTMAAGSGGIETHAGAETVKVAGAVC